jgi:hypothetical protein
MYPNPSSRPQPLVSEIHSWGAAAVIAHPVQFRTMDELEAALACGVDGLEAYHPSVTNRSQDTQVAGPAT